MENNYSIYRNLIARCFYGYCLLWLTERTLSHALPPQLLHPQISETGYNLTFWLYQLSGFSRLISVNNWSGWLFVGMLYAVLFILILFPGKNLLSILYTFLLLTLDVTTNIYVTHSMHYLGAMLILSIAFWGSSKETFSILWRGARYYCCWAYGSAFLWKLILGAFWQWDNGVLSFKGNLATYLFLNPDTLKAHLYYWFLQNDWLLNAGDKLIFLAEGLFLIGFFTKKWDKILIVSALLIFLSTYFFSDVFFAEQLILILPFIGLKTWKSASERHFSLFKKDILAKRKK